MIVGDSFRRVNAEFECMAAWAFHNPLAAHIVEPLIGRPDFSGDCVLGVSKAPMFFKNTTHELCHIRARLDYLSAYLDCLKDPDPGKCCINAYAAYCTAAAACDAAC